MHITRDGQVRQQRRTKQLVWTAIVAVGMLLPFVPAAQAQVTAYAVIPSWTQSKVLVRDAHTGVAVGTIPMTGEPYDAAITPDGRYAYVTLRASHRVAVIDLGTLQEVTTIPVGLEPRGVAITPDGTRAWITEASSNTVSVIDIATNTVVGAPIAVDPMPWGIALTPQGDRAYVVNRASSTVTAIDLATQTIIAVIGVDQEPVEIVIAPNGHTAYVTSTIADTVVPIDLDTHEPLPSIPVGQFPRDLAITPDGTRIFVANSDAGTVSVIETSSQSVIATIPLGGNVIPSGVALTPEARQVLVSTQTFDLRIIDANSLTLLSTTPLGGQALRVTSTRSMVVPSTQGPLPIATDAALTTFGFNDFIAFRGGRLRLTNNVFTPRHLSVLTQGGTIDTQQFHFEVAGTIVNDGILAKRGTGTLTFSGSSATHQSTHVFEGTLSVAGTHASSIRLGQTGTLAGTGTVGDVDASQGVISPGVNGPGELTAGNVQMTASHTLVVEINGLTPGLQYDRLAATGGVSINGATLVVQPGASMPKGSTFTIVTNANGTFAGLPDGSIILTVFGKFRISYTGGPTQNDVVLHAL